MCSGNMFYIMLVNAVALGIAVISGHDIYHMRCRGMHRSTSQVNFPVFNLESSQELYLYNEYIFQNN